MEPNGSSSNTHQNHSSEGSRHASKEKSTENEKEVFVNHGMFFSYIFIYSLEKKSLHVNMQNLSVGFRLSAIQESWCICNAGFLSNIDN